jgi:hypothetical protein
MIVLETVDEEIPFRVAFERMNEGDIRGNRWHDHHLLPGEWIRDDFKIGASVQIIAADELAHRHEGQPRGSSLEPRQKGRSGVFAAFDRTGLRQAPKMRW